MCLVHVCSLPEHPLEWRQTEGGEKKERGLQPTKMQVMECGPVLIGCRAKRGRGLLRAICPNGSERQKKRKEKGKQREGVWLGFYF